jgi:serine/threonine-protein kinase
LENESVRFGQYELVKRLARGGMAEIFLAIEHGAHGVSRHVVIKRVLPQMMESEDFVTMFMDEARLVAKLGHPNIAHVHGFGDIGGVFFLVMEYVDGLTLSKLMRVMKDRRLPLQLTLRLAADACAGLHYAHEVRDETGRHLGVVHRDISPQNIMVSRAGLAKLIDFGVAQATTQAHITAAGQLKGKLAYMSPEQFRGRGIDRRADVFAIGAVLHEMVTGERLFLRENEAATMHALMFDEPASVVPYGAPPELDLIIRKAVQKSPAERFRTALELQEALEALIAQRGLVVSTFQVGHFVEAALRQVEALREKVRAQTDAEQGVPDLTPTHLSHKDVPRLAPTPSLSADLLSAPTLPPQLTSAPRSAEDLLPTSPGIPAERGARSSSLTPSVATPSPASDVRAKRTRRPVLIAGVAVLLLALTAGGAGLWLTVGPGSVDAGAPPGGRERDVAVASTTPPIAPVPIPTPPEPVPIPLPSPATTGRDGGADASEAGTGGEANPSTIADAGAATKTRVASGTLFINTTPWSTVRLGGRSLGQTPIVGAKVPAGTHRITLTDGSGVTHLHRVTVRPNQATKVFLNLRSAPSL